MLISFFNYTLMKLGCDEKDYSDHEDRGQEQAVRVVSDPRRGKRRDYSCREGTA